MKFLVDNQLPVALARFLTSQGHGTRHVLDLKLEEADDSAIWNFTAAEGYTLISKDQDFLHLANASASSGTFIWVRLGNCRKQALIAAFERSLPDITIVQGERKRSIQDHLVDERKRFSGSLRLTFRFPARRIPATPEHF